MIEGSSPFFYADSGTELVVFVLFISFIFLGYKYVKLRSIHKKNQKELMQKVIAQTTHINKLEIDSTKFQLNPHAFKNTLNTVKLLAEKTTESIDHLSDVLDYMVYESRAQFVSPAKEIQFLENFIKFNQLRINEYGIVRFINNVKFDHHLINQPVLPPLITAYFVENAFKHGLLENKGDLEVTVELRDNRFYYTVKNPINPIKSPEMGGVGYDNMVTRLNVIFPHRHTLKNQVMDNIYVAHLEIELRLRNEEA